MYNCKCAVRRYYSSDAGVARRGRQCTNQMSRRSSICAQVCELADHGLLGEGLLPTMREVFASGTAAKDACVVPRSAYVEAALFEDASLAVWKSTSASGARCGTSITTPSSRRRADGVEDNATTQRERAVKF